MATSAQLGIYWGNDSFSVVETVDNRISNILKIPFDTPMEQDAGQEDVPDALKFPVILKKALDFRSIKSKNTNLSLPAKDLIFRSFTIPFMEKADIQSVVEFEITKYIPLKLDDLVYTYHTVAYHENNQKNLRVLFIAIRKKRLDEMLMTINEAGLVLQHIEPAPISLMHLLQKFKLLPLKSSSAVLQIGAESTEVIVFKDATLNFVRKLNVAAEQPDLETLQNTLINEVRVSFNFFERQNPDDKIKKLLIISQHKMPNIEKTLSSDLNISSTFIPIEKFIPIDDHESIAHLNALGTTFRKGMFSTKFFDLSDKAIQIQRSGKDPLEKMKRYGIMSAIAAGCALVLFSGLLIMNKVSTSGKATITQLKNKLGAYASLEISDLKTKSDEAYANLSDYTDIRTQSQLNILLAEIPRLLPEGAWLETLTMSYDETAANDDPNIKLELAGKIFSKDPNQQFYLLSEIIRKLKKDKILNQFYGDVKRSNAERSKQDDNTITLFTITCHPK